MLPRPTPIHLELSGSGPSFVTREMSHLSIKAPDPSYGRQVPTYQQPDPRYEQPDPYQA